MGNRNAREIIKKLLEAGYEKIGQKGSHIKFKKSGKGIIIVPDR